MPSFHIFGVDFSKLIFLFGISTLKFAKFQNFAKKENYLHVRTKMPYLVIFGVEFQKTIATFEINTLRLVKFQNLLKKQKMPKFWSKYVLFGCFWGRILKSYCHI